MNRLSTQEMFDRIVTHLRTQGDRAISDGKCKYLAPDGKRCAVGCLIPESDYRPEMEGVPAEELVWKFPSLSHLSGSQDFLYRMQRIHDGAPVSDWESRFKDVARHFLLDYTPKDNG